MKGALIVILKFPSSILLFKKEHVESMINNSSLKISGPIVLFKIHCEKVEI